MYVYSKQHVVENCSNVDHVKQSGYCQILWARSQNRLREWARWTQVEAGERPNSRKKQQQLLFLGLLNHFGECVFFALFKSSIAFLFFFPSFLSLSPFNAFKMMQRSIATQLAAIISSSVIYNIWIADPVNAQDYGKISRRNRATVKRAALGIVSTLWQLFKIS